MRAHSTPAPVTLPAMVAPCPAASVKMPKFTAQQLDDRQLDSVIRYVEQTKHPDDRGGWSLAHIGPIPEGLVAWLLAGSVLVGVASVIGGRAR